LNLQQRVWEELKAGPVKIEDIALKLHVLSSAVRDAINRMRKRSVAGKITRSKRGVYKAVGEYRCHAPGKHPNTIAGLSDRKRHKKRGGHELVNGYGAGKCALDECWVSRSPVFKLRREGASGANVDALTCDHEGAPHARPLRLSGDHS
jgi:hypothetical protein